MKDWLKFTLQDRDGFIVNLYDVVQLLDQEEEMARDLRCQIPVGSLPPVLTILTNQESCRDDPRRAQCFP